MGLKLSAAIAALSAGLLTVSVARADGEAGLVIDYGDGRVDTYCVAFEGDSISGEDLLERAGVAVDDKGGLVCTIGGTGCPPSDCLCRCRSGGSDCTYWAFFTQRYGASWVYSALGYRLQRATDGDLHAWAWGPGGPASAPAPASMTFEQVCGHPPGMIRQAPTGTPIATVTPLPTSTPTPSSPGEPSPSPTAEQLENPTQASAPTEATTWGISPTPARVPTATSPAGESSATPVTSSAVGNTDGGADKASLAAFAGLAGLLAVALGAAVVWRRRHGH